MLKVKELHSIEESYQDNGTIGTSEVIKIEKAWVLPMHVFYTTTVDQSTLNTTLISTEFYSQDKTNTKHQLKNKIKKFKYESDVVDVFAKSEPEYCDNLTICVVLVNGALKSLQYQQENNDWLSRVSTKLGGENEPLTIVSVTLNSDLSTAVWCQKDDNSAFDHSIYIQRLSINNNTSMSSFQENSKPDKKIPSSSTQENFKDAKISSSSSMQENFKEANIAKISSSLSVQAKDVKTLKSPSNERKKIFSLSSTQENFKEANIARISSSSSMQENFNEAKYVKTLKSPSNERRKHFPSSSMQENFNDEAKLDKNLSFSSVQESFLKEAKPVKILYKCPECRLTTLNHDDLESNGLDGKNGGLIIMCLPVLAKPANIFLLHANERTLILNTKGALIYKTKKTAVNLLDVLYQTAGKWKAEAEDSPILHHLNSNRNKVYLLTKNFSLINFNAKACVSKSTCLKINERKFVPLGFVLYAKTAVFFTENSLEIFDSENGECLTSINLNLSEPVSQIWNSNFSLVNLFGFVCSEKFYQVLPLSVSEILKDEECSETSSFYYFQNPELEFLSKMSSIVRREPIMPSSSSNNSLLLTANLQSPALLLALLQYSRETSDSFKFYDHALQKKLNVRSRLNNILAPLVDAFITLDDVRLKLIQK